MPSTKSRLTALLAALAGLSACVPSINLGCVTDPLTGEVRCHGGYTPPPPPPPETGERG